MTMLFLSHTPQNTMLCHCGCRTHKTISHNHPEQKHKHRSALGTREMDTKYPSLTELRPLKAPTWILILPPMLRSQYPSNIRVLPIMYAQCPPTLALPEERKEGERGKKKQHQNLAAGSDATATPSHYWEANWEPVGKVHWLCTLTCWASPISSRGGGGGKRPRCEWHPHAHATSHAHTCVRAKRCAKM